ncbi:hypothetical protein WT27_04865 [Burkholderia territorii]|uniref:Phage tail assembly chaperone-like domain-containing protein n=2 Tax=Burkholderia territorii TaxID=1503055 RepID=A0A119AU52_9BURK|nr:hypothetical protein WT27_04865 [Burkholderia territorii]
MGQKYAEIDETRRIVAFYDDAFHSNSAIPPGAIKISDREHRALLEGQSQGKCMALCEDGRPTFIEHRARSEEEITVEVLRKRTRLLEQTDGIVARHRDQVDEGIETTLSDSKFRALLAYRRELRDLTKQHGFPNVQWPESPL